MIYSLVPFTWLAGYAVAAGVTLHTTAVVNGVCYTLVLSPAVPKSGSIVEKHGVD